MAKLVLTAIGRDRAGLVQALSSSLDAHAGNWLESEFLHLAGHFAGIALVDVPDADVQAFTSSVSKLEDSVGLRVEVTTSEPESAPTPEPAAGEPERMKLHLLGQDRPGMVRQVTSALVSQQVTIEEFSSWTRSAPEGGGTLFEAEALIQLAEGTEAAKVRDALEQIASELMVDLELS